MISERVAIAASTKDHLRKPIQVFTPGPPVVTALMFRRREPDALRLEVVGDLDRAGLGEIDAAPTPVKHLQFLVEIGDDVLLVVVKPLTVRLIEPARAEDADVVKGAEVVQGGVQGLNA